MRHATLELDLTDAFRCAKPKQRGRGILIGNQEIGWFVRVLPGLRKRKMSDVSTSVEGKSDTALSPSAKRMRLHRERRRDGLRCLTIELRETEIDALVHPEKNP
jgi:hypothetical protein